MIELTVKRKVFAERLLFRNFSVALERGELLCLLGPSGCGKTTLLNLIAGLDANFEGHLSADHGRISYMFQEPRLLPWRTVRANLALVLKRGERHRIMPLLQQLGLADRADSFPAELSLGMARRVALARSLIVEPELILMDEPFVSLDPLTARELYRWVEQIRSLRPQTSILLVTHDVREALMLADRILLLGRQPSEGRQVTEVIRQYRPSKSTAVCAGEEFQRLEQALLDCLSPTAA